MDHGVACFESGAIVWASKRDVVIQKVDELAKFGFVPHQPIFQTDRMLAATGDSNMLTVRIDLDPLE